MYRAQRDSIPHWAKSFCLLLPTVLLTLVLPAREGSKSTSPQMVVDRYLDALLELDVEAMSAHWTESIVYADPTADYRCSGLAEVSECLSSGLGGIEDLDLEIQTRFHSMGYSVLIYEGRATFRNAGAAGSERKVRVRSPGVMVLRLEGEKVAEHIDYVDYPHVQRQLDAAAEH